MTSKRSILAMLAASALGSALVACSGGAVSPSTQPTVQSLATQAAPTAAAAATQAAPTLAAAATQAAPTVQALATSGPPTAAALATQSAPTMQAAATQAAPTVQALATQVAPIAATASANAPVRILGVQSSGSDATISLQNTSTSSVDLSGWQLRAGTASVQLPAGLSVQPGQTVTLHMGSGTSTASDVYLGPLGSSVAPQLKPGAQIVLQNPNGTPATAFTIPSA